MMAYTLNLQGIDLKKLFIHLKGTSIDKIGSKRRAIRTFFSLLKNILLCTSKMTIINYHDEAKIIFLQPMKSGRQDLRKILKDVSSLLNESEYDYYEWKKKISFSIKRIFTMIHLCRCNWHVIYEESKYWILRWKMLSLLIEVADMEKELLRVTSYSKYNLCVVIYDAYFHDNFFSQKFKLAGVKTATLQHGVMLAARKGLENSFDFIGIEFNGFVSDYFLVWNDFTKKEAMKQGVPEKKIKVLGNVKCLYAKDIEKSDSKTFGVILDGICEEENNLPMISLSNKIAEKYGYKYIARYHPNFKGDEYSNYIDDEYGKACKKGTSFTDFLSEVSFCIVANSSVLFELPYYQIPYFRYSAHNSKDKFYSLEHDGSFYDIQKFDQLFVEKMNSKEKEDTPSIDKLRHNYESFLRSFI